jgi:uncharacterized protein
VTSSQTSHIKVTYTDSGVEITAVYAVNEEISRELGRRTQRPTGTDLQAWLESKGCRLDSTSGPAFVRRHETGEMEEYYYRDGRPHREDGPAAVWHFADGAMIEEYYRDGKLHREDGPAAVRRFADGAVIEEYYRDGKLHREGGPAFVWRNADGSTEEKILSR